MHRTGASNFHVISRAPGGEGLPVLGPEERLDGSYRRTCFGQGGRWCATERRPCDPASLPDFRFVRAPWEPLPRPAANVQRARTFSDAFPELSDIVSGGSKCDQTRIWNRSGIRCT